SWQELDGRTITRFEPWGRTKYSQQIISSFKGRVLESGSELTKPELFSKTWCAATFKSLNASFEFPVDIFTTETEVETRVRKHLEGSDLPLVLKAPFGSSGRNMLRIMRPG